MRVGVHAFRWMVQKPGSLESDPPGRKDTNTPWFDQDASFNPPPPVSPPCASSQLMRVCSMQSSPNPLSLLLSADTHLLRTSMSISACNMSSSKFIGTLVAFLHIHVYIYIYIYIFIHSISLCASALCPRKSQCRPQMIGWCIKIRVFPAK